MKHTLFSLEGFIQRISFHKIVTDTKANFMNLKHFNTFSGKHLSGGLLHKSE
jgi:hypothetical protein